jgi:spore coat protein H
VEAQHLARLDVDKEARVPCTIVYDGTTFAMAGIRKKGGNGSWRPLSDKPAFSIKFNEFVQGQKLLGLSKLLLNNAVQDPSFLHEHVTYELARKAGAAAPLTAHGLLTFNGKPYGLYVVREAMNDDFLRRSFGKDHEDGNLYEGGEFIGSPNSPELKDEQEEMRTRADIQEVSRLVNTTPDEQWLAVVGAKLDIPSFLTGYAVESLIDHWDGYFFGPHNYYVYHHPGLDRFVFLVAGADSVLGRVRAPSLDPKVLLARKFLQFPETRAQLAAILKSTIASMDAPAMEARLDQAARVIHTHTPTDARVTAELKSFDANLPMVKTAVRRIKAWTVPAL